MKFPRLLILLLFANAALGAEPVHSPFDVPLLATDEQKLQYLGYIHEHLPRLFEDAARYDVDLFKILDDQRNLDIELRKIPAYAEAQKVRKALVRARATIEQEVISRSYEIKPEAIANWKKSLIRSAEKLEENETFEQWLKLSQKQLGKRTNAGMFWGMISSVDPQLLKESRPQGYLEQMQMLQKHLPEVMPSSFKGATYGLPVHASKDEVISAFRKLHELQMTISNYETLDFLAKYKLGKKNASIDEVKNYVDLMDKGDLEWLTDRDATQSAFETAEIDKKIALAKSKTIQEGAGYYAKQTRVVESQIKNGISLVEVPPSAGIFRGCSGGDCSSQYSFPYPNDPHEKVFFIEGEGGRLKGYVTGTVAEVEGKKVFYVITISGPKLNSGDTKLVFRTLRDLRSHLGVTDLAIPAKDRLYGLVNFSEVRGVFDELASGPLKHLVYLNPEIRTKIENFHSDYNTASYDKMVSNQHAHLVSDEQLVNLVPGVKIESKEINHEWTYRPKPLDKTELILFSMDLESSGRQKELKRVLDFIQFDQKNFNGLKNELKNTGAHTVSDYESRIREGVGKVFDKAGIARPADEKLARFIGHGYANCTDLFSDSNRSRSTKYFAELIREYGNDADHAESFRDIFKPILTHIEDLPENSKLIAPTLEFLKTGSQPKVSLTPKQEEWVRKIAADTGHHLHGLAQDVALRDWKNALSFSDIFVKNLAAEVSTGSDRAAELLQSIQAHEVLKKDPTLHATYLKHLSEEGYNNESVRSYLMANDQTIVSDAKKLKAILSQATQEERSELITALIKNGGKNPSSELVEESIRMAQAASRDAAHEIQMQLMNFYPENAKIAREFEKWNTPEFRKYVSTNDLSLAENPRKLYAVINQAPINEKAEILEAALKNTKAPSEYAIAAAISAVDARPQIKKPLMVQILKNKEPSEMKDKAFRRWVEEAIVKKDPDIYDVVSLTKSEEKFFQELERAVEMYPDRKNNTALLHLLDYSNEATRKLGLNFYLRHPKLATASGITSLKLETYGGENQRNAVAKLLEKIQTTKPVDLEDAIRLLKIEGKLNTLSLSPYADKHYEAYEEPMKRFAKYVSEMTHLTDRDIGTFRSLTREIPKNYSAYLEEDMYPRVWGEMLVSRNEVHRQAAVEIKNAFASVNGGYVNQSLDPGSRALANRQYDRFFNLKNTERIYSGSYDLFDHAVIKDLDFHKELAKRVKKGERVLYHFRSYPEQEAFWIDFVKKNPKVSSDVQEGMMQEAIRTGKASQALIDLIDEQRIINDNRRLLKAFDRKFAMKRLPAPAAPERISSSQPKLDSEVKSNIPEAASCRRGFIDRMKSLFFKGR